MKTTASWALLLVLSLGACDSKGPPGSPNSGTDPLSLGISFLQEGDADSAIGKFSEAIGRRQDLFKAHLFRSRAYLQKDLIPQAIADLREAIRLEPGDAEPHLELGIARDLAKDENEALREFTLALSLKPDLVEALWERSGLLYQLGRIDEALADCNRALGIAPNHLSFYVRRGNIHGLLGQQDRALADWEAAIRIQPQAPGAYYSRGMHHAGRGNFPQAIADFSKVLELTPSHVGARQARAGAHAAIGRYAEAIADFDEVLRLHPRHAATYLDRSDAYRRLGQMEKAEADYKKALELEPSLKGTGNK